MYLVAIEGEREQTLDLSGVYRVVAMTNPADGRPLSLDTRAIVTQMTVAKDDCVLPKSTRDALHALVWGAVAGQVTTFRFVDGPAIALTVQPGDEYQPPPPVYGQVKAPDRGDGSYRKRRYGAPSSG